MFPRWVCPNGDHLGNVAAIGNCLDIAFDCSDKLSMSCGKQSDTDYQMKLIPFDSISTTVCETVSKQQAASRNWCECHQNSAVCYWPWLWLNRWLSCGLIFCPVEAAIVFNQTNLTRIGGNVGRDSRTSIEANRSEAAGEVARGRKESSCQDLPYFGQQEVNKLTASPGTVQFCAPFRFHSPVNLDLPACTANCHLSPYSEVG